MNHHSPSSKSRGERGRGEGEGSVKGGGGRGGFFVVEVGSVVGREEGEGTGWVLEDGGAWVFVDYVVVVGGGGGGGGGGGVVVRG